MTPSKAERTMRCGSPRDRARLWGLGESLESTCVYEREVLSEGDVETFRTEETFPEHEKNEARFPPLMDVITEIRATGFSVNGPALLAELESDE